MNTSLLAYLGSVPGVQFEADSPNLHHITFESDGHTLYTASQSSGFRDASELWKELDPEDIPKRLVDVHDWSYSERRLGSSRELLLMACRHYLENQA